MNKWEVLRKTAINSLPPQVRIICFFFLNLTLYQIALTRKLFNYGFFSVYLALIILHWFMVFNATFNIKL